MSERLVLLIEEFELHSRRRSRIGGMEATRLAATDMRKPIHPWYAIIQRYRLLVDRYRYHAIMIISER